MIHIESKTGESYPICNMDSFHLANTIELLVKRCQVINEMAEYNPRYINDIEGNLERLALYYFDAKMRDLLNPIITQKIETVYHDYRKNRAKVFI